MLTRDERLALLERGNPELPLSTQADFLCLNRTGLYYEPKPISQEELAVKRKIDEIYTMYPFYGSRRIAATMCREGVIINRKAVQRNMREMGIEAVYPGPNLSKRNHADAVFPYLLRNLTLTGPNQVWGTDITYIRLQQGWMYLAAIMDWHSRYVLAWELRDSLEISFVLAAVQQALGQTRPQILNSDQGSQFTSPQYIELVQAAGVRISMDGKGRATDNIFTERLWRSLKYEEVYLREYTSPRQARQGIAAYLDFYNHRRVHQSLDYQTPAEVHFGLT
jgi:putative transposase